MSYLINSSFGPQDIERATVPFILANAAANQGDARVFLTCDALNLVVKDRANGLTADGYAPVGQLIDEFVGKGGRIWVCKVCAGVMNITQDDLKIVTKRQPTEDELRDLLFAWKVAKHVKSNAIVYVKDGATVGVGAGQMSRVDSCRIAARKSQDMAEALGLPAPLAKGSVVASDAFFPFADGLLTAAEAGATAVIQPGGSMRDDEVIAAADAAGLAMVLTGMRHFRH